MATTRSRNKEYDVGEKPPTVGWTFVKGDTSAIKDYVTDDAKSPLTIADWTIAMKIKRPNLAANLGKITDDADRRNLAQMFQAYFG